MATFEVASGRSSSGALDPSVIRRWVERTCASQGLPVVVTDAGVISRLVVLLGQPTSPEHNTKADA